MSLKVIGNHVMYDRSAWFQVRDLNVYTSTNKSSVPLTVVTIFFRWMYNKINN